MFHVVDLNTGRVLKTYTTRGWAVRYIAKLMDKTDWNRPWYSHETLAVMDSAEYNRRMDEINPMVEVINMMSGKPVLIRKSDAGTCVDPSTETYWSM